MFEQLVNLLIPSAYADTVPAAANAAAPQAGNFSFLIIALIMLGFLYLTVWRPQSKRAKEQQSLMNSLTKGDEVVTIGGILGRIAKISDQYLLLTIGNNTDIAIQKSSVATVLPKGTLKSIE
jgi:preprotein translocase subunit YajC